MVCRSGSSSVDQFGIGQSRSSPPTASSTSSSTTAPGTALGAVADGRPRATADHQGDHGRAVHLDGDQHQVVHPGHVGPDHGRAVAPRSVDRRPDGPGHQGSVEGRRQPGGQVAAVG